MSFSKHLLSDIQQIITQSRKHIKQSINQGMVQTYWQIGRLIVEYEQKGKERAEYGKQQLEHLSSELTNEFGKGFDARNLYNMRLFYSRFPISYAVRSELSWSHYRSLIRVENPKTREWYMTEAIEQNWSARALDRQISVLYYERLLSSKQPEPVRQEAKEKNKPFAETTHDFLRDPYILDFLDLPYKEMLERNVEKGIINNLQDFLLELGKGFAFVERQQRISTNDQDFYVDLVFYNFKLKCFLLVALKLGKLTHQDVGQMDSYVRIYDQHRKGKDDNPTIGLILCSQKSEAVAKYSVLADNKQLFSSKYLPYLPSEAELEHELEKRHIAVADRVEELAAEYKV